MNEMPGHSRRAARSRTEGGGTSRPRSAGSSPRPDREGFASDADAEEAGRAILLRQLAAAPRSRGQLEAALAKRLVPEHVAGRLLDRFTEVGLIDDEEYAAILVRTRHGERGLARRAIAMELRRKGIDDETAATALAQVDSDDEEAAARALVRRKLRTSGSLDPEVARRRIYGALGRKGYSPGLVAKVLRDELAHAGDELARSGDESFFGVEDV
ncbi:MAG: regulatory protein RecX [Brevundimonas sp.]